MSTSSTEDHLLSLEIPMFRLSTQDFISPTINLASPGRTIGLTQIQGLGDIVIEAKEARLMYQFPFDVPSTWLIVGNAAGISKRAVITGIRSAYRHRYRQSDHTPSEKICSRFNEYSLSYPITSLYIDSVFYSEKKGLITVDITSNPTQTRSDDLPF